MSDFVIENNVLVKYTGQEAQVVIPQGVTEIGERAFCDCTSLEKLTIGGHVKTLKEHAFHGCTNLKTLVLEEGVKTIKYQAFRDCRSLASVELPNSVTSIGKYVFQDCRNLQSVKLSDGLKNLLEGVFQNCKKLTDVKFGQNIGKIDCYVFLDCAALQQVTLPDRLEVIGWQAFSGCKQLQNVVFNKQLTGIGEYVFSRCASLLSVELPQGIQVVYKNSFPKVCKVTCPGNKAIELIFPAPVPVVTVASDRSLLETHLVKVPSKDYSDGNAYVTQRLRLVNMPHELYGAFKVGDCVDIEFAKKYLSDFRDEPNGVTDLYATAFPGAGNPFSVVVSEIKKYPPKENCLPKIYVDYTVDIFKSWEIYLDYAENGYVWLLNLDDNFRSDFKPPIADGIYEGYVNVKLSNDLAHDFRQRDNLSDILVAREFFARDYWAYNHGFEDDIYFPSLEIVEHEKIINESGITYRCFIRAEFEWHHNEDDTSYVSPLPHHCNEHKEYLTSPTKAKSKASASLSNVKSSDGNCSVLVEFDNGKSYRYNCEIAIAVGDKVHVGGKLAGQVGIVAEIGEWNTNPYMQDVTEIIK